MGRKPLPQPGPFSRAIADYINVLVRDAGGDLSGRWLAKQPGMPQALGYYRPRQVGDALYTTNDIADVARLFEMSPQALVRAAVAHAEEIQKLHAKVIPIRVSDDTGRTYDETLHAADRGIVDAEEGGDPTP